MYNGVNIVTSLFVDDSSFFFGVFVSFPFAEGLNFRLSRQFLPWVLVLISF